MQTLWYYTYVLECKKTNTFYTGCTNNLKQRIEQHKKGEVGYTRSRLPIKLIYFEACLNKSDAFRREKYLKTGMGKKYLNSRIKDGLAEMNPVRPL
ncbi:MAG: GIY-YIG nuclease family protein [Phycisphaerales bacterium]